MATPTNEQKSAIDQRTRTLLVSAAAGSGKTFVLTNRIIQSLLDGMSISDMLIVTFTRAAAAEMRTRIAKKLTEELAANPDNKNLKEQLMLLSSARISTIDSFYYDLVRSNFQAAGLPPTVRMAEDTELDPLRREEMNAAIDEMYGEYLNFEEIADIFCNFRDESKLTKQMLELYEKLNKFSQGIHILKRTADELRCSADTPLATRFGKSWAAEVKAWASAGRDMITKGLALVESAKAAEARAAEEAAAEAAAAGKKPPKPKAPKTKDGKDGKTKLAEAYHERLTRYNEILDALDRADYTAVCSGVSRPFSTTFQGIRYQSLGEELADLQYSIGLFNTAWRDDLTKMAAAPLEAVRETALRTADALDMLHELLRRYHEKYTEAKRVREVAEFSDISRAAYELLVGRDYVPPTDELALIRPFDGTAIAKDLAKTFKAIYVDEYQDVDAMQDTTFRAIATPTNRFMVGDIKQSIYRFRGAQPRVFARYKRHLPALDDTMPKDAPASIFMSDCFRCDENVIKFANAVSGYLFSHNAESISYTDKDDLHFKKEPPTIKDGETEVPDLNYQSPLCRVMFVQKPSKRRGEDVNDDEEDSPDTHADEARLVAREIGKLIGKQKKADGTLIRAKDIAVLMRSTRIAKPLGLELANLGIPYSDTSKKSFFENPEVLCMYSLLATVDNPMRDVYLAATLRSPFFGFTLQDLVVLRSGTEAFLSLYQAVCAARKRGIADADLARKVADFLTRLGTYQEKAQALPVDKLIRYLYRDTGVLAFAGFEENTSGGAALRRGNLRRLYEYARTFEMGGFKGLHQFVRYVDSVMENETKLPSPEGGEDAVSLITIHHSKGLEFPVCFVVGTGSKLNTDDTKPPLLCDDDMGCATQLCNAGPFSRTDTFFRQALAADIIRQNREEEMRVLYVAMTRAEEFLYVTGATSSDIEKMREKARKESHPDTPFLATRSGSYMKWILAALSRVDHSQYCTLEILDTADPRVAADPLSLTHEAETRTVTGDIDLELPEADEETVKQLKKRLEFCYPHAHLTHLPAKLSVSNLSPTALDVFYEPVKQDGSAQPAVTDTEIQRLLKTFERKPQFGQKTVSAAEKGTATHEFLQFCDFDRVCPDSIDQGSVEKELARLVDSGYLSMESGRAVRIHELKRFFKSKFFAELYRIHKEKPQNVYREKRFHISLPARDFTSIRDFKSQLGSEMLTVQGVIDLFYIDDDGNPVLCDYKTDRLTPQELQDPLAAAETLTKNHGTQLSYYAKALEGIYGKPPAKIVIFSLHLGEDVTIKLNT